MTRINQKYNPRQEEKEEKESSEEMRKVILELNEEWEEIEKEKN